VQKRLLARFKEKTPAPLGSLPALLELTQADALAFAARAEELQATLAVAASRLAAAASLTAMLVRCRYGLDERDAAVMRQSLGGQRVDETWEECADAAMMQLLRTTLAKSTRDQANVPQPLVMPPDTQRLRKHIALVVERVGKGMKLTRDREKKGGAKADPAGAAAAAAPGGPEPPS
jgi:Bardet-Biedl syndrome 9 protein